MAGIDVWHVWIRDHNAQYIPPYTHCKDVSDRLVAKKRPPPCNSLWQVVGDPLVFVNRDQVFTFHSYHNRIDFMVSQLLVKKGMDVVSQCGYFAGSGGAWFLEVRKNKEELFIW